MAQASLLVYHGMFTAKGKEDGMIRDLFLSLALVALLGLAVAITSGAFGGPSDLEMFKMNAEPFKSQP